MLAIGEITGNATITQVAGYEGIITGLSAVYAGLAEVLNEMYKRTVAPLGKEDSGHHSPGSSFLSSKNRCVCADEYFAGTK